jgi:hypothetical protein
VLDDEAQLVHVRAQHHRRRARRAGADEELVPERVGLVPVVVSGELVGDQVGDRRLVAGDAGGRVEAAEQGEGAVGYGAYPR